MYCGRRYQPWSTYRRRRKVLTARHLRRALVPVDHNRRATKPLDLRPDREPDPADVRDRLRKKTMARRRHLRRENDPARDRHHRVMTSTSATSRESSKARSINRLRLHNSTRKKTVRNLHRRRVPAAGMTSRLRLPAGRTGRRLAVPPNRGNQPAMPCNEPKIA
jgi:hypothetical protein